MADELEKLIGGYFKRSSAAQEREELFRLLEEMRQVQEKLSLYRASALPLSEAELRSQFYKWYQKFVEVPVRPGSELWRPVEQLIEEYNRYVRQFGRGVELLPGAGMKELREAAKNLIRELYSVSLPATPVSALFTRRTELARRLYEMALSSPRVRRALRNVGLIPVTWSTEQVFARAVERFLDEEDFLAYFVFYPRAREKEALLAGYFRYDFPRYGEFLRELERFEPGLGEAWVRQYAPAEELAIRGYRYGSLARFERRPTVGRPLRLTRRLWHELRAAHGLIGFRAESKEQRELLKKTLQDIRLKYRLSAAASGEFERKLVELPGEMRDIFAETAPEAEVGVPPTKPTSPSPLKAVVRQERAGFYVREALAELEEREYFSRYFPRGASEIDRLRARLLKTREPEAGIARVLDYVGRELVELRTGTRWRVAGQTGELVRLVPVLDDPRRLRFAWKHRALQDLLEAVEESYAPRPSPAPVSPPAAPAAVSDAVRRAAEQLLGVSGGELAYSAARYPGVEAALYAPVKRAIERMPYYRHLFTGVAYSLPRGVEPEDIVQDLNLYLMEYARQWAAERNITQVTKEVRQQFLEDWYRAASRRVREFLFQMRAQARGIPEEEFRRALGILSRFAPREELSAADIAHLRARLLKELKLPTEREPVAALLDVAAEELEELSRLTRAASAEPLSIYLPIRPSGRELEEGEIELLELLGEPKETVGERIVSRLPTPEEAVVGRESVPPDEAVELRRSYRRYKKLLEEHAALSQLPELTKRQAARKRAIEASLSRLEAELGAILPTTVYEPERVERIARVLISRPELATVTTAEGYPVELLGVRGGISEWRIAAGPEAGRVLRIGAGGAPLEIRPEDIPSLFTWGGYTGAFGKYTLPLTSRLEASTRRFRSRAVGILETLEALSELKEGQRVVVFDIETTTLPRLAEKAGRPDLFAITEIAARRYLVKGGRLVPEGRAFRRFVRPSGVLETFLAGVVAKRAAKQQISEFEQGIIENIQRVGGIERLRRRGVLTAERAIEAFRRYVKDADVILGQGITEFDIPEILEKYKLGFFEGKRIIDLQTLAAYLGETRMSLEHLVARYAPERIRRLYAARAHEAGVDVAATAAVFNEMAQRARERYAQESFVRIGDYVVRHTVHGGEGYRGIYRILNFEPERNVLELLRVDTGELATLAAPTRAELEHLFYSQFYHLGPEYWPEIDLRYAQDRAARMVRKALENLGTASYYRERFRALEAYAAAAGLPLEEVRVLEPAVLRRLPEEQWRMLAAMRTSELRAYQQAYRWWTEEFERVHASYLEELEAARQARLIAEDEAARRWKSYTAYLSGKFPFRTVERAAEPFEQRLELELAGQRFVLRAGARQWAESSLRRALSRYAQAIGAEGEKAEAAKLAFLKADLVPALRRLGVQVGVPEAEELGAAVQEVAAALARHRVPTVRYEDVLTPRTSEAFVRAAEEIRRRLAGEAAAAAATPAPRPDRAAEFLKRLGEVELAPLARTAERYSMARAWGLEALKTEAKKLLEHPQVRKFLPAALALPLAYLGFQMLRNDPIDLGPHTPRPVRGPAPYEWTLAPDMRLYAPQAPVGFDVRISATDRQGVAGQELAAHVHQGVQQALGVPLEVSLIMRDNTNQLSLDWWQRQIADALAH